MRFLGTVGLFACGILGSIGLHAGTVTIDFEGVLDSTPAGVLYAGQGVTFSSGLVLVSGASGGSLNEFDYPPMVPGQAVFVNDADTTQLTFSQPLQSFSGYFTYGGPLVLNFYGAGNTLLTVSTSAFATNVGNSPNELISAPNLADAVRVDILAPGTDFTLDDLTFTTSSDTAVPEPGTGILVFSVGAVFFLARRYRSR
jgi:hypothetical protein